MQPENPAVEVGDIVLFRPNAHERTVYNSPDLLPAIVTRVQDGFVNLTVFNDSTVNTFARNVREGWGEGNYSTREDVEEAREAAQQKLDRARAAAEPE